MSYMQTAEELRTQVVEIIENLPPTMPGVDKLELATKIGHVVNMAIRCCPRGVQHTVRKNIVAKAVEDYCRVTMTEKKDEFTGREYHQINITSRMG